MSVAALDVVSCGEDSALSTSRSIGTPGVRLASESHEVCANLVSEHAPGRLDRGEPPGGPGHASVKGIDGALSAGIRRLPQVPLTDLLASGLVWQLSGSEREISDGRCRDVYGEASRSVPDNIIRIHS